MPIEPLPQSALVALVSYAASGDGEAFSELVRRFEGMALAYARRALGDASAAEDAAQDAFVEAWRGLGQLREPAAFPGWLRTIVRKHCDRRTRRAVRETPLMAAAASAPVDTGPDLDAALAVLPPAEAEAVALYYLGGRSIASVARFLDAEEATVKTRLHRARARLRDVLAALDDADDPPLPPARATAFLDRIMRLIKPVELDSDAPHGPWSCRGHDVWDIICAALTGDAAAIRRLLARSPDLHRAEYWYTQPIHFAVREGHVDAVRALLDGGADPTFRQYAGDDLVTVARDRGHEDAARLIETARATWRPPAVTDPATTDDDIHRAAAADDAATVAALLDADAERLHRHGAKGRLPLHAAAETGALAAARALLERGADPNRAEGRNATRGHALYTAAKRGDRALCELLLAHGADPNATVESSGSATWIAGRSSPELRALLEAHGGRLDVYDLIWLHADAEALARVQTDPRAALDGCGTAFAAACTLGKRDLVHAMLAAGARIPNVVTGCRSYLWEDTELLRVLLAHGMSPDLPEWQRSTPLHSLCGRDGRGRMNERRVEVATILLDAGATIDAVDEEYRSTPLAWAARADDPVMADLLLSRGAAVDPPGEAWAKPIAWATRRGHVDMVARLRAAGAR